MTKLNITNKRIYKLKKHKNQSKKNVPKKRKNKKRGRPGRSFRKRRRKYNIKNNSIKNYKRQKGGVITTIGSRKGKFGPEKVGRVFKSEELKKKETELKDVQRKIQELDVTYKKVTAPPITAKRVRFAKNEELVGQLGEAYDDMTQEDRVPNLIKELKQLHNEIGDDDDIKKLSNRQMKALKLKTDIDHTQFEINIITPILRGAKKTKNEYKKATDKKKRDVKKQEKAVVEPAELERLQKALNELETKKDKKKEYDKQKKSFDTKKAKSDEAKDAIVGLNKEFNAKWGTWKTDDDTNKNEFIEAHLKGNPMMQGEAKNTLTYLEVIEFGLKDYQNSAKSWKKTRKDEKLRWETIEKESKNVSAKITAESVSKKEEYEKNFATETAKKEKLEKEIEALTKKEDEKLSAETDEIAKGLKTGKIKGLEGNIEQQENVVKTIQGEVQEAVKDAEKKKKKADVAWMGKDAKRKAADDAQRNVEEMEKQEKKAKESLRAKKHWEKGLKGVGSILHTEIKSSLIVPHVHDNDIQTRWRMIYNDTEDGKTDKQIDGEDIKDKFKKFLKNSTDSFNVLIDQPYIYNPEGPYAHTTDDKQSNIKGNKAIFYNYYLKKTIKSPVKSQDGKDSSLIEMISQRMSRYINYVMGHNGTDDEKKSHKETIAFLNKQIQKLFKPNHLSIPIGKKTSNFRDYLNEKMNAINFLEILLKHTVQSFPQGDLQRYTDLMETSIDDQPLFDIFCSYLGKCYDMDPTLKLQQLATNAQIINPDDEAVIEKGLSGMNLGNNKPCEPPVDDYGELYLRVGKGLELYSKEVLDGEEEEKRKVVEALKKYEENAKETEEIQKQTTDLLQDLEGKIKKIKNEKYFIDGLKEDLDKLKRKTHSLNVVAKEQEMKNNTEGRAKLAAATDLLKQKKLESAAELQKHQAAQKEKDKEIENLRKREEELKAQMESQQEAVNKCGDDSVEEKRRLQEALDKKEEELAQAKAATEAAKQDKTTIDDALIETEQIVAEQEAESEDLSRKEEQLNDARKELLAVDEDKENKEDDKESDEEDDEFDFGIIDEMANRPDKDVEIDFGGDTTVVLMARLDKDGNVQIEQRNIGKGPGIEKEISNYGMGNFESTGNSTIEA